jgi:hypothetical protein
MNSICIVVARAQYLELVVVEQFVVNSTVVGLRLSVKMTYYVYDIFYESLQEGFSEGQWKESHCAFAKESRQGHDV